MEYTYSFDLIAATEYEYAFNWCQQRSEITADNLLIVIGEAVEAICKGPYRYRNMYKELRELSLKKYPYHLIYFIDENKKHNNIAIEYQARPKNKYKK